MKQYRKKPVTVEAVQFDGLNPTEIKNFVGENCEVEIYDNEVTPPVARIVIHTLEGDMEVSKGDYVIKGVKGEFYPCKPDIFQQTYESAETQKELEEAAEEYTQKMLESWRFDSTGCRPLREPFIAGAEWQAEKDARDMYMSDNRHYEKVYQLGKKDMKEQMLKDAVEAKVVGFDILNRTILLTNIPTDLNMDDKIRIIIIKED